MRNNTAVFLFKKVVTSVIWIIASTVPSKDQMAFLKIEIEIL